MRLLFGQIIFALPTGALTRNMLIKRGQRLAIQDVCLLLKKNIKIQLRHPVLFFLETILPCLLALLVASLRTLVPVKSYDTPTIYPEFSINNDLPRILEKHSNFTIYYYPNHTLPRDIMAQLGKDLDCSLVMFGFEIPCMNNIKPTMVGFDSVDKMIDSYLATPAFVLCAIEFDHIDQDNIGFTLRFSNLPRLPSFEMESRFMTVDWKTNMVMREILPPGPRDKNQTDGGNPGYQREGFLYIQHKLSFAIAKVLYDGEDKIFIPELELNGRRFPYPKYIDDKFLFFLNFLFPTIIMFSFFFSSINLTRTIVNEKEKRLKESMKMMGLQEKHHFIAYFIKSVLSIIPGIVLIIVFLKIKFAETSPPILTSDAAVLFVYFLLYEMSNICFSFMMSSFFSKANLAGIITGLVFFLTYMPYFPLIRQYNASSSLKKIMHCFLPNTNMALGIFVILMRESRGVRIAWDNILHPAMPRDIMTLVVVYTMFMVDSVIFLLVTWYMTLAFPGQYGIPLPWYFPFTKEYWFENNDFNNNDNNNYSNHTSGTGKFISVEPCQNPDDIVEAYPKNVPVGISIRNLEKTYDHGKTFAIKNLSLDIFENQITVLLGHNGAGKTTTISILCGLFPPSKGTAIINGHDVRTEMNRIRSNLGICPQFNLLFDYLTVAEHLEFYCKLKHTKLTEKQIQNEIKIMVKKLDLEDKIDTMSSNLSGGMKRKLSVGIAFIGGSKIIILDEPTSGMDVCARRFIWDLLLQEKKKKVIIISTHFMEEADILGDRIAIMDNGQLRCYGSPLFLKKRFGSGYYLRLEKKTPDIDTEEISKIIKEFVPNSKLESSVGVEIIYSLPSDEVEHFSGLLSKLETDLADVIVHYGISITTMEEVFLKVGQHNQTKTMALSKPKNRDNQSLIDVGDGDHKKNTGCRLLWQQFYALIIKRSTYSIRNPMLTLSQFLIPLIIIIAVIFAIRSIPIFGQYRKLELSLDQFETPLVKYFVSDSAKSLGQTYGNLIREELNNNRVIAINSTDESTVINTILASNAYEYNFEIFISSLFTYANDSKFELRVDAMFNGQPYHTPAIALKYVDQALIRHFYQKPNLQLSVSNSPLPRTPAENVLFNRNPFGRPGKFQIIESIIYGLSFFLSSFAIMIVTERIVKAKHIQKISGLPMFLYWCSLFLIDYLIYLLVILAIVATFIVFKVQTFHQDLQPFYLFAGLGICGLSVLPMVYVLSFCFSHPATAYAKTSLVLLLTTMIALIIDNITAMKDLDLLHVNRVLRPIFQSIFPMFDISKITDYIDRNYLNRKICNFEYYNLTIVQYCVLWDILPLKYQKIISPCCIDHCGDFCLKFHDNPFAMDPPGIGSPLLYVFGNTVLYWTLLVLIEIDFLGYLTKLYDVVSEKFFKKSLKHRPLPTMAIDEDVLKEKTFVENLVASKLFRDYPLVVDHLCKRFKKFTAVDDISFCVRRGECFGLLGVNGAGKTTTFNMITGDIQITSGRVFIMGQPSIKTLGNIGYCPQFDALFDDLTGEETLRFYGRLKGIPEKEIQYHINELSRLLYFEMHLNKATCNYSGGNKRKLSTAIALLSNPAVSFLDEPSSGVDPVARRCLWEAMGKKLEQNLSIVLSSHSMEECETLCNRLVIMVNGQICCIGSPLQLKKKFGNSYSLTLKISQSDLNDRMVAENDAHDTMVTITTTTTTKETSFIMMDNQPDTKQQQQQQQQPSPSPTSLNSADSAFENLLQDRIRNVRSFIKKRFPTSQLKAIHNNMLEYTIQNGNNYVIKCSEIFQVIEANKTKLVIEDYSVSQTNLEQIFLTFAREQRESKDFD